MYSPTHSDNQPTVKKMDPFNIITAIATTAAAVLGYRKMLDQKPVLRAEVADIPNSNRRDFPEREKLQQEGFYVLRIWVESAPQNWDVVAVKIADAEIPSEITSRTGDWLADRLPDKHQIKMTHGKVKTHNWKILKDKAQHWDFLIKPDDPEKGLLTLTLYGHLWAKVKIPFAYQKTQFF